MTQAEALSRVPEMSASGKSDVLIARELGLTLAQVLKAKSPDGSGVPARPSAQRTLTHALSPDGSLTTRNAGAVATATPSRNIQPKEIIERLVNDLDECAVLAMAEYRADPASETGYSALTSIVTTLKELLKSHEGLNDPQETAEAVVSTILRPMVKNILRTIIINFDTVNKELSLTFNSDNQRIRFKDALSDVLRSISEQIRTDYNRGVRTLEDVYDVPLDKMYLKKNANMGSTDG